jgi:hypothetical protein
MRKVLLLPILFFSLAAHADDDMAVTPYRPSVSNPAQLPTPGQLEMELGGLRSQSDGLKRDSLPYLLKLGFTENWGILVGGEAHVSSQTPDGTRDAGIGDTAVTLKRAFLVDDATAYGIELGVKIPTANDVLGSGKADYGVNGIFSKDIANLHVDANLNVTRIGLTEEHASDMQTGASASFSMPFADKWGADIEISGIYRRGTPSTSQLLLAATYTPVKKIVLDFGVAKGLSRASQDWSIFGGVVVPVAKLW